MNGAHVFLHKAWAAGVPIEPDSVHYDDGTALLLVQRGLTVHAYDTFTDASWSTPEEALPAWSCALTTAAPVIRLKCSPDQGLLAVQRSKVLIEFIHVQSGNTFVHGTHKGLHAIKGFFFASTPACDLIIVTQEGLELSQYCKYRDGLRSTSRIKVHVAWYIYSPAARTLLLGAGPDGTQLHAWLLDPQRGPLKLPSLHLNLLLNPAAGAVDFQDPWQLLSQMTHRCEPRDIKILRLYGAPYCAYLDRQRCQLHLYRLYRDAVVHHLTYSLFSEHAELSTIDNLIVAHHTRTAQAVLFDIRADTPCPITPPLPLHPPANTPSASPTSSPPNPPLPLSATPPPFCPADGDSHHDPVLPDEPPSTSIAAINLAAATRSNHFSRPTTPSRPADPLHESSPWLQHSGAWEYILPNVIWDPSDQVLYRLHVDLEGVMRTCRDLPLLVGFLCRRRRQATPQGAPPAPNPKALVLALLRRSLQQELPPVALQGMFEQLARSYGEVVSAQVSGGADWCCGVEQVVTPQDVAVEVFQWAREEAGLPPLYLQAALSEYELCMAACSAPMPLYLHTLALDIWLQQGLAFQATQALLQQPAAVCGLLGKELRRAGRAALLPEQACRCLEAQGAISVYSAAGATADLEAHCQKLLQSGRILLAARIVRNRKLDTISPGTFLAAAARAGDKAAFTALYRMWSEGLRSVFSNFAAAKRHYFPPKPPESVALGKQHSGMGSSPATAAAFAGGVRDVRA